ncbi:MAG: hypothetical protein HYT38_01540 [Candidatus Sungbacteria bacterium]|uniref:EF-hand domain-containing protein n=1 Tax=Candidatus Sungiibacteriota bacterium TaxID=2750080 RepID=A0A9D6DP76_9BACT|nr:hypothetical protein [Candidatus Sungbacteria bacterium]
MLKRISIKVLIVPLVFLILPLAVFAQVPQLPHIFYGDITINGSPAPVGTVIVAKIGGVEKGRIVTTQSGKYGGPGVYDSKLLVQGDITGSPEITFTVTGVPATSTVSFESGKVEQLNLSFTVIAQVDGSVADVSLGSAIAGEASLPAGATSVTLSNTTSLNLASGVSVAAAGNITVSGVSQPLASFTSGNLTNVNLSVAQTIGGQAVTVGKAVKLESGGVAGTPIVLTNTAISNASVSIPDTTTILAPSGWNGTIEPPKTGSSAGTAPSGFSVGSTVISVGSPDVVLIFDKSVTLTLTGVSGAVGYKPAGSDTWVSIDATCSGSYASPGSPTFPGECKITNGTDTKIVTYHFTTFGSLVATTPTPTPNDSGSGGGGGGGGGGNIPATSISFLSAAAQKVDANKDNKIDVLDFNALMVNWGSISAGNSADFNNDGQVDVFDFNLLMVNWTL